MISAQYGIFQTLTNVNATFNNISMTLSSNNTDTIYMFGTTTASNITTMYNITVIGPMSIVGAMSTPKTNLNMFNISIYGTKTINYNYYSGNTGGAIGSISGPISVNISNYTCSNYTMNGTGTGLFIGSISNAIFNCYNITNNASFGYNNNGYNNNSQYAGMIWSIATTSTLFINNYT